MKEKPEESASFMAIMDIEITAEDTENMNTGEFITAMLSSEMVAAGLPDFSPVEIGDAVIDGETAIVSVTIDGETNDIELVSEDGSWKIDGNAMDIM